MEKKVLRKCPICNNDTAKIINHIVLNVPEEWDIPGEYDVVACDRCGMAYADTPISDEQLSYYYCNHSIYENDGMIREQYYKKVLDGVYEFIDKYANTEMNILDMGCASGEKLLLLREHGYKHLTGMELDPKSIEHLKSAGVRGKVCSIYDAPDRDDIGAYDFVMVNAVFEHLLYPVRALDNLSRYINADGRIMLIVPSAIGFPKYNREIPNYFNQEHINYFTPDTLDMLMGSKGFRRISTDREAEHISESSKSEEVLIYSVYQRDVTSGNGSFQYSDSGEKAISQYFDIINKKEMKQLSVLKQIIDKHGQVAVWGTGSLMRHLFGNHKELLDSVSFFVDNDPNKQKEEFFGKKVYPVSKLIDTQLFVVICIMLDSDGVEKQIETMNMRNEYCILSLIN